MTTLEFAHIIKDEFFYYYLPDENGAKKSLLQIAQKIEEILNINETNNRTKKATRKAIFSRKRKKAKNLRKVN